ncbi:hypothetical protein JCM1840_006569 [Sporobolomyces johnsonii]
MAHAYATRASTSHAYPSVCRAAHDHPPTGPFAVLPSPLTASSGTSQLPQLPQPIDLQGARIKLTLDKVKLEIVGVKNGLEDVKAVRDEERLLEGVSALVKEQLAPLLEQVTASARAVCDALSADEDKAAAVSRASATLTRAIQDELVGQIESVESELKQELGEFEDGVMETLEEVAQRVEQVEKVVEGQAEVLRGWQEKVEGDVRMGDRRLGKHADLARRVEVLRSSAESVAKVTPGFSISADPDPAVSLVPGPLSPTFGLDHLAGMGFTAAACNATSLTDASGPSRPSLTTTEPFSLNISPAGGANPAATEYQTSTTENGASAPAAGPSSGPFTTSPPPRRRAKTALPAALPSRPSPVSQIASTALLPTELATVQKRRSARLATTTLKQLAEPAKGAITRAPTKRRFIEQDEEAHKDEDDAHGQQKDMSQFDTGRNGGVLVSINVNSTTLGELADRNGQEGRKRRRRIIEQDSSPKEQVIDEGEGRPRDKQKRTGRIREQEEEDEELGEPDTQE